MTIQNRYEWSPRFGIGNNAEMICLKKRKYGFIKTFLMKTHFWEITIENVFGEWEDIIFYHDNTNLCCLTKTKNLAKNNLKINVYIVKTFIMERSLNFIFQFSFVVDLNFPSFFTTKIFMAPNTFIISKPNGLLTILNRMLTLSEYSIVSLLKVPDSRKSLIIKETILEKLMKIVKLRKKTKLKTWMSLNFIKDVLSLPNSFSLLSLSDY